MIATKENIVRVSAAEARLMKGETDYARIDAMTDDDIAKAVASDPDAAPLDIDWDNARLVIPPGKDVITLRLDRDVLEWLRAHGKGYQTLINQVLRAFYEAKRPPLLTDVYEAIKAVRRNPDPHVEQAILKALKKPAAKRKAKKAAAKPAAPGKKARMTDGLKKQKTGAQSQAGRRILS